VDNFVLFISANLAELPVLVLRKTNLHLFVDIPKYWRKGRGLTKATLRYRI